MKGGPKCAQSAVHVRLRKKRKDEDEDIVYNDECQSAARDSIKHSATVLSNKQRRYTTYISLPLL
jgi:hypothetical protein